jgi:hypothetical protein
MAEMKAVVLSLHRSATRSTIEHLINLGLPATHYVTQSSKKEFRRAIHDRATDLDHVFAFIEPLLAGFEAVGDVPVPVLYRQFERRYPEARFILVRRDPAGWVKSVREHVGPRDFAVPEKVQYWEYFPDRPPGLRALSDAQLVRMYEEHTERVKAHFVARPEKLGVFEVKDRDTPQRIAAFLGIESRRPFPHVRHDGTRRTPWRRWTEAVLRQVARR